MRRYLAAKSDLDESRCELSRTAPNDGDAPIAAHFIFEGRVFAITPDFHIRPVPILNSCFED